MSGRAPWTGPGLDNRPEQAPHPPPRSVSLAELIGLSPPPEWMEEGACVEVGGDPWYPERGEAAAQAKQVCFRCSVRTPCLEYALAHDERFGIWGGLSRKEREDLRRGRRQQRVVTEQGPDSDLAAGA